MADAAYRAFSPTCRLACIVYPLRVAYRGRGRSVFTTVWRN